MSAGIQLPPGFVLVRKPGEQSQATGGPPPGFEVTKAPPEPPKKVRSGDVLPFSTYSDGSAKFDSDAGVIGIVKGLLRTAQSGVTLPRDVFSGAVDPMSDEAIARSMDLAGLISPVNPAVRAGDRAIPGIAKTFQRERIKPPSAETLKEAGAAGYKAAREMGVDYSSRAVSDLAGKTKIALEQDGILAELAPKSHAILQKLQAAPDGSVAPLTGIEAARRALGHAAKDFNNPPEQLAARRIMDALDDFVAKPDPKAVVAGPAAEAGRTIVEARGNYAAGKRSETIGKIAHDTELQAAAANSGQNLDNTIRQKLRSLEGNAKKSAGFNEAELDAIREAIQGGATRNTLRYTGNLLGGGGGLGQALTMGMSAGAGAVAGGGLGAAAGAMAPVVVGTGAKQVANALASRALTGVDDMVRMRSPLAQALAARQPINPVIPAGELAVVRALLAAQSQSGQPQPR